MVSSEKMNKFGPLGSYQRKNNHDNGNPSGFLCFLSDIQAAGLFLRETKSDASSKTKTGFAKFLVFGHFSKF